MGATAGNPDTAGVDYSGCWTGALGVGGDIRSISGCGPETFSVSGHPVAINAQMRDQSGCITVYLSKDGDRVASNQSCAQYGVAQVAR